MYCQKCKIPLKVDQSLEDLNPDSFDLLVGSYSKAQKPDTASTQPTYPSHRKELYDRVSQERSAPSHKRTIPAPQEDGSIQSPAVSHSAEAQNPAMSFIEITESQIVPTQRSHQKLSQTPAKDDGTTSVAGEDKPPLSWELHRHERLFAILSAYSDIDHPICAECTSLLLTSFKARLTASVRERDAYVSFLKDLQINAPPVRTADQIEAADRELEQTLKEEQDALHKLEVLEEEKESLEAELTSLEDESRALALEEQNFWSESNDFEEELRDRMTSLASLQEKYTHDQQRLERLQRANVFNDTFCIGYDGSFVTINGLRLGRLPSQHVEWAEINAAWGQTLLLLATAAERLNFEFRGYRLKPLGSTSRIEKVEWPQQAPQLQQSSISVAGHRQLSQPKPVPKITPLDLFSSGEMPLGRVFYHRRFDAGMVAFLDCLSQLGDHVEKLSHSSREGRPPYGRATTKTASSKVLPYPINGDKIGDPKTGQAVSIKLGAGFQQDESWTKACKYALTCCKFLLAYVSNMSSLKDARESV